MELSQFKFPVRKVVVPVLDMDAQTNPFYVNDLAKMEEAHESAYHAFKVIRDTVINWGLLPTTKDMQ